MTKEQEIMIDSKLKKMILILTKWKNHEKFIKKDNDKGGVHVVR